MQLIGSVAMAVLAASIVLGPIAILIVGNRASRPVFIALIASGALALPFSAAGQPEGEAGLNLVLTFVGFMFGLLVNWLATAIRTPRRARPDGP